MRAGRRARGRWCGLSEFPLVRALGFHAPFYPNPEEVLLKGPYTDSPICDDQSCEGSWTMNMTGNVLPTKFVSTSSSALPFFI